MNESFGGGGQSEILPSRCCSITFDQVRDFPIFPHIPFPLLPLRLDVALFLLIKCVSLLGPLIYVRKRDTRKKVVKGGEGGGGQTLHFALRAFWWFYFDAFVTHLASPPPIPLTALFSP